MAKKPKEYGGRGRFELTFRRTADHVGIAGNKDVDKEAKAAAEGKQTDKVELPSCLQKQLWHSLSAVCQAHNDKLKLKWAVH